MATLVRESKRAGDVVGDLSDSERVPIGERGLCIDDVGEGLAEPIDLLMGEGNGGMWREIENEAEGDVVMIAGRAAGPKCSFAVQVDDDGDKFGVEPMRAAFPQDVERDDGGTRCGEDVEVLRDGEDAGEYRDGVVDEMPGVSPAVPVLVERQDGSRDALAEAEFTYNFSATLATESNKLHIVLAGVEGNPGDTNQTANGIGIGEDRTPEEAQIGPTEVEAIRPVLKPDAGLDDAVVAADNLAHAGGVAAATDVFEEESEVEVTKKLFR